MHGSIGWKDSGLAGEMNERGKTRMVVGSVVVPNQLWRFEIDSNQSVHSPGGIMAWSLGPRNGQYPSWKTDGIERRR